MAAEPRGALTAVLWGGVGGGGSCSDTRANHAEWCLRRGRPPWSGGGGGLLLRHAGATLGSGQLAPRAPTGHHAEEVKVGRRVRDQAAGRSWAARARFSRVQEWPPLWCQGARRRWRRAGVGTRPWPERSPEAAWEEAGRVDPGWGGVAAREDGFREGRTAACGGHARRGRASGEAGGAKAEALATGLRQGGGEGHAESEASAGEERRISVPEHWVRQGVCPARVRVRRQKSVRRGRAAAPVRDEGVARVRVRGVADRGSRRGRARPWRRGGGRGAKGQPLNKRR